MTTPSTEVAQRAPEPASELARMRDPHTDGWVTVLQPVAELAQQVSSTDFVPKALRNNTAAVTAAILFGRELGMAPMHSLSGIHMVEGKPTLAAETMRAQVLAAGHEIGYGEVSSSKVEVKGRRKGETSWTVLTWTLADAQRAGLANKNVWKSYPRQMLTARATAELCRLIFPDVTHGMRATEEMEDGGDLLPAGPAAAVESTTKVGRRKAIAPVKDVELPEPAAPAGRATGGPVDIAPPPPPAVQSKPDPVAVTPGEGDGSATDKPSTATGPILGATCPVLSNGVHCRLGVGHVARGADHSFGGGLKDPIEARHCEQTKKHPAHAWPDHKPAYACRGEEFQTPEESAEFRQEHGISPEEQRERYAAGAVDPEFNTPYSDDYPESSGPVDAAPKPMHAAQTKALQARFKGLGFTDEPEDREARLGIAGVLIGRTEENPVNTFRSTGDGCMTYDEAQTVLTRLAPCRSRDDVVALMVAITQDLAAEETQD